MFSIGKSNDYSKRSQLVRRGIGRPPKLAEQLTADSCVREVRRSDRVTVAQTSPPTPLTIIHPEM